MTGLAESRLLYETAGRAAIAEAFPDLEGRIAVGLCGRGSECFGYDDELSRDHDFETGFCLWLTDEDDRLYGPALSRLYRTLRPDGPVRTSALGEKKLGVLRISDYFRRYTGSDGAPESALQWLSLPSYALAEAVNGEVWRDDLGVFSSIRKTIREGMPEDVRKKKIAARTLEMAQSGQYNVFRALAHSEPAAAHLAADAFVRAALELIFLLNRAYAPYYKWVFRALRNLPKLSELALPLEEILNGGYDGIGIVAGEVIEELRRQNLTSARGEYLEDHAFEVQSRIAGAELRSMHILEG